MATKASPYSAMLDACVLYPAPLRDLLIQLAAAGLYRAKWSDEIHEEWIKSVLKDRRDLTHEQLERTRDLMNRTVLDCLVDGYQPLIPTLTLPDRNDRHVLAAAIHARCDALVTYNLKDFPAMTLNAHNIEPIHPDDFIFNQFGLSPAAVITAAHDCLARLHNPRKTAQGYLNILLALSLPKTVGALTPCRTLLGEVS